MANNWTEDELRAAVVVYIKMRSLESKGKPFVKKQYYAELAGRFDRSAKAFEFRMQNISYVYSVMGRQWVTGLLPAKNIGTNTAKMIQRLISEVEGQVFLDSAAFESEVSAYKAKKSVRVPSGVNKPERFLTEITQYYRDPQVKGWVLNNANGVCEACDECAPFRKLDGDYFLEVHHLKHLSDGGSDTVKNAIALCPNCHKEMHYGENKEQKLERLYKKHKRLSRE